jgi:hypothetical protein
MINAKRAQAAANDQLVVDLLTEAGPAGLSAAELAARGGLPQSTTKRVIRRLVGRRAIQREGMRGSVRTPPEDSVAPELDDAVPQRAGHEAAAEEDFSARRAEADCQPDLLTWRWKLALLAALSRSKYPDIELLRRLESLGYVHWQQPVRGLGWWQLNPEAWPWPDRVTADVISAKGARAIVQLALNAATLAVAP